ncbi:unnamed protein product (macronuclear) [Paramecium tetraurelia]|uniref:Uncharacterized protein n=1 Tax=Paramecium tetraurelia TaxID=5888 RepID=A0BEA7_PARTE|nr:uncharacterized protein GSPATT00027907001 [Paramecium tetraurelia]CAK56874.1 unnamed protein product [Paramecium tetraurelia]|eukprot:XP_001424272.1 hypothetical protein (macronuclear) [Paramecium tetraurelia strain d4-2]
MLNNLITIIAECQINSEQIKQLFVDPHLAFQMLSSNGHDIDQSEIKRFISLNDEEIKHQIIQFNSNSEANLNMLSILNFTKQFLNFLKLNNNHMSEKSLSNSCNRRLLILSKFFVFSIEYSKIQILKEDSSYNPTELFNQIDQFGKGYIHTEHQKNAQIYLTTTSQLSLDFLTEIMMGEFQKPIFYQSQNPHGNNHLEYNTKI